MASNNKRCRPRLQLQFTGQGAERALPLTTENVESVFTTVDLHTTGRGGQFTFGKCLGIPEENCHIASEAAQWWMKKSRNRTWRHIIFRLDWVGKTEEADILIPYAEPPSDQSMTPEIVTTIFEGLEEWERTGHFTIGRCIIVPGSPIIVPVSRADIIRENCSHKGIRKKAAQYYININPFSNWGDLAEMLYTAREERAINIFKAHLPIPKDPTLTLEAMMRETEGIILNNTSVLGEYSLEMPDEKYDDIIKYHGTKDEARVLLFKQCLLKHPYPRWELVVDLLERLEGVGKAKPGFAQELKEKYLTMSDEKAQEILDTALQSQKRMKQRNSIVAVTGINGAGKTSLISCFFGIDHLELYSSTGIADRSYRGLTHHIASLGIDSWELLLGDQLLEVCVPQPVFTVSKASTASATQRRRTLQNPFSALRDLLQKFRSSSSQEFASSSTAPSSSSKSSLASAQHAPEVLPKESHASQVMMRLVKKENTTNRSTIHLLHMIDTGGQPEFMEVIPSLLHNSNLTILVLNLAQGLDVYPEIAFYEEGKPTKRPHPSSFTNRQIIQRLARTMQAKKCSQAGGRHYKVLVVGTHRDCVKKEELPAVLTAVNKALKNIFAQSLESLQSLSGSSDEIVFPINALGKSSADIEMFNIIRNAINKCTAEDEDINIPIAFFMFENDIMELAQQLQRDVLSRQECIEAGKKLKMTEEMVQAALIFFHNRTIFMYFQHVLPEVVFVNPQMPLNLYKMIVIFHYKVKSGDVHCLPADTSQLLEKACIKESILHQECFTECFHHNIYEPCDAINLFCYLYSISPLEEEQQPNHSIDVPSPCLRAASERRQSEVEREYLMISLLPDIPNDEIEKILPPSSNVSPLVIQFSGDCVPIGCFGNMIACAISKYRWSFNLKVHPPKHNIVTLCPPNLPLNVTLVDSVQYVQVHINSDGLEEKDLLNFCPIIQSAMFSILKKVFDRMNFTNLEVQPAFLCSCNEPSSFHPATARPDPRDDLDSTYLICSETGNRQGKLEWRHRVWFDGCKNMRGLIEPPLPMLLDFKISSDPGHINIAEHIGKKYHDFGIQLLNDTTGCIIDAIEYELKCNALKINMRIMQLWLEGKGSKPIAWSTLTNTLRKIDMSVLATTIEENL